MLFFSNSFLSFSAIEGYINQIDHGIISVNNKRVNIFYLGNTNLRCISYAEEG